MRNLPNSWPGMTGIFCFRSKTSEKKRVFSGLPDPLVLGSDSRMYVSPEKILRKTPDSYCFVTSLRRLNLKNDVNVASKRNKQKK